jgi:hypothetical protein
MTVTYVGSLSIGDLVPGAAAAAVAGAAGINAALPDIQARIAALASFSPAPVDFAAQLALAQQMVASITASISLGLPVPSIAAQIAIVAAQIAALEASVLAINANLTIVTDFQDLLTAAGIHVYAFDGQVQDLGNELDTELSGGVPGGSPTDASNALVMVTTVSATWTAISQVFKVAP